MKAAIRRELRETAHRFLGLVYMLERRHGGFNRELLEWLLSQTERYEGPNPREGMLTGLRGMLGQSDDQLYAMAAHFQATMPPQFVPVEEPAYTAGSVSAIHDLEPDYARRVLDILAHIRMLNDARENGLFHTRLTFTPGLSELRELVGADRRARRARLERRGAASALARDSEKHVAVCELAHACDERRPLRRADRSRVDLARPERVRRRRHPQGARRA